MFLIPTDPVLRDLGFLAFELLSALVPLDPVEREATVFLVLGWLCSELVRFLVLGWFFCKTLLLEYSCGKLNNL